MGGGGGGQSHAKGQTPGRLPQCKRKSALASDRRLACGYCVSTSDLFHAFDYTTHKQWKMSMPPKLKRQKQSELLTVLVRDDGVIFKYMGDKIKPT